jgi:hypothetical protein
VPPFSGYDTTRFKPNNLTFAFGADFSRDLLVSLQSITYNTVGSSPLLAKSIDMFINSLVTEIWLPVETCQAFAQQFGLTWNTQGQLYLIDEIAHAALLAQNPTFTFTISQAGSSSGGQTIDIVLPYAAFNLNLTAPIVGNTTRYFPLKQAQNSTQYTFGRTFLQEAYVIADYERHNFSVFQALFPSTSVTQSIIAILPPGSESKIKQKQLSAGAIAGIVVAAIAVLSVAILAAIFWSKGSKKGSQAELAGLNLSDKDPVWKDPVEALVEASGADTAVQEADGQQSMISELQTQEGPRGRHELMSPIKVHEADGRELMPAELEAGEPKSRSL